MKLCIKVFCTDLSGLIHHVINHRDMSVDETDLHIGLDGGQGWLKVGLIVTDRSKEVKSGRAHYSEVC